MAVGDRQMRASLSIGVATTRETRDPRRLLQHADLAPSLAAAGGRGRVETYDAAAHRRIAEALELREDLALALPRGELRLVVAGICQMAHALGLQTVVEGVEDAERAAQLRALRCDAGQGSHWARPLPPEEVAPLLSAWDVRAAVRAAAGGQPACARPRR